MTCLLAGGAGFIGSHIAVELLQMGQDVIIADDLSNSEADVVERIEKITGRKPTFWQVDVADQVKMDALLSGRQVDAVIHL